MSTLVPQQCKTGSREGTQSLLSPLLTTVIQIWDDLAGAGCPQQRGTDSCPPQSAQRLSEFWAFQGWIRSAPVRAGCAFTAGPSLNTLALDRNFSAERSELSQFELETKYLNPEGIQGWGGGAMG